MGQRSRSVWQVLDLDSLAERVLQHDLVGFVAHLEPTREPVHSDTALRAHEIACHAPGCLPGVIRIAQVGPGWVWNGGVLAPEVKEVARHAPTSPSVLVLVTGYHTRRCALARAFGLAVLRLARKAASATG